jgi:peptidoglycan/LPS O-acetylase OafA/YrhL
MTNSGGLIRIAGEFVAGCALFLLYRGCRDAKGDERRWAVFAAAAAAGVVALGALRLADPFGLVFFVVLIPSLALSSGGLSRLLATPTAVFMGEASYSLYMTHSAVLKAFDRVLPSAKYAGRSLAARSGVLALELTLVILIASLTYLFIERPAREMLRRRVDARLNPRSGLLFGLARAATAVGGKLG